MKNVWHHLRAANCDVDPAMLIEQLRLSEETKKRLKRCAVESVKLLCSCDVVRLEAIGLSRGEVDEISEALNKQGLALKQPEFREESPTAYLERTFDNAGTNEDWEELARVLLSYCRYAHPSLVNDHEDMVQETLKVIAEKSGERGSAPPLAWVLGVTRNFARKFAGKARRAARTGVDELPNESLSREPTVEERGRQRAGLAAVTVRFWKLTERERDVFVAGRLMQQECEVQGVKDDWESVARQVGGSSGAVQKQFSRVKCELLEAYKKEMARWENG